MNKAELSKLIFEALGEASMCWSEKPKGVFESTRAREIGERLLAALLPPAQEEAQGKPYWYGCSNYYEKSNTCIKGKGCLCAPPPLCNPIRDRNQEVELVADLTQCESCEGYFRDEQIDHDCESNICNNCSEALWPSTPVGDGKEAMLAKERNIVCWIVPVSYKDGRVTWGYEIELLPYSPIASTAHLLPDKSYIVYSYEQWPTYDEARKNMFAKADEIYTTFLSLNNPLTP